MTNESPTSANPGTGGNPDNPVLRDQALAPIPESERNHWFVPAMIFGGLEFAVPVIMVGAALIAHMSVPQLIILILLAMAIQWIGNSLQGYMGAKSGLSSAALARQNLGVVQARIILGLVVGFFTIGWGAVQTAIAGNAISALFGIDYEQEKLLWGILTVAIGLIFATPSVLGYTSIKWVDYLAVPAGILLISTGVYLSIAQTEMDGIIGWEPVSDFSRMEGIGMILGLNVAQWLIASDYTRYSRPRVRDQILIPLGIICIGIPLLLAGAVMSIGHGQADIVMVMRELRFPAWGYLVLCLAVWTSQLVNFYSMGIAISNTFNIHSSCGRALSTLFGAIVAIVAALLGLMDHFMDYLYFLGLILPPVVGVMFADFFLVQKSGAGKPVKWKPAATLAIIAGLAIGFMTQYYYTIGIPVVQSLAASVLVYFLMSGFRNSEIRSTHPEKTGKVN